jgi:uncharacterized protein (TIGR02145 family)
MKNTISLFVFLFAILSLTYSQTVTIGSQVWMNKNLDVAKFRNGDPIPEAKTNEEWVKADKNKQPVWSNYDSNPANGSKYGKLYNWYAVNDPRGLAPEGYHVPTDAEWTKLENFLGSDSGKKMKSATGWNSYTEGGSKTCPNCASWSAEYRRKVACHKCKDTRSVTAPKVTKSGNGTNSSGFSGLPGGYRLDGTFYNVGKFGEWWSSSEDAAGSAWVRYLDYDRGDVYRYGDYKEKGLSVRCLRD